MILRQRNLTEKEKIIAVFDAIIVAKIDLTMLSDRNVARPIVQ